jgi:hypothetical protein
MSKIKWVGVQSSAMAAVAYDYETHTLFVLFTNGKIYPYAGVGKSLYERLLTADSIGRYFLEHIKPLEQHDKENRV